MKKSSSIELFLYILANTYYNDDIYDNRRIFSKSDFWCKKGVKITKNTRSDVEITAKMPSRNIFVTNYQKSQKFHI